MDQLPHWVFAQALGRFLPLAFAAGVVTACGGLNRTSHRLPDDQPITGSETTLLIVADNHDHSLLGRPYAANPARPGLAPTLRSPLLDVGSGLLLREAVRFGARQGADVVLHLGDAANVSCLPELFSTLFALEEEAPGPWYFAPGSHDGRFAGGIRRMVWDERGPLDMTTIHSRPPAAEFEGTPYRWGSACDSPGGLSGGDTMTKDEAIRWPIDFLRFRPGAASWQGEPVDLDLGHDGVRCSMEHILIPGERYAAIARRCPPTHGFGPEIVGPEASFLVQRVDIGDTRIILLDTSHLLEPHEIRVGLRGSLGQDQKDASLELFYGTRRDNVIVVGHHPFNQLPDTDRRWIAERASRYISAHRHESATLRMHGGRHKVLELNVASITDVPSQAVVMHIGPGSARFRVAGADVRRTGWAGYLAPCEDKRAEWALTPEQYRRYRRESYVPDLIAALKLANDKSPVAGTLQIPDGTQVSDWMALEILLNEIATIEGDTRTFWTCQAYYAAEATQPSRRPLGWFRDRPNGTSAVGGWYRFETGGAKRSPPLQ